MNRPISAANEWMNEWINEWMNEESLIKTPLHKISRRPIETVCIVFVDRKTEASNDPHKHVINPSPPVQIRRKFSWFNFFWKCLFIRWSKHYSKKNSFSLPILSQYNWGTCLHNIDMRWNFKTKHSLSTIDQYSSLTSGGSRGVAPTFFCQIILKVLNLYTFFQK